MSDGKFLKAGIRVLFDFAIGFALFLVVVGVVSDGHSTAQAYLGSQGQAVGTSVFASFYAGKGIGWDPLTRDAAILLLATTFGAITALNMAFARHLRSVVSDRSTST